MISHFQLFEKSLMFRAEYQPAVAGH